MSEEDLPALLTDPTEEEELPLAARLSVYLVALTSAFVFSFLAIFFSIKIIWVHLKNYNDPKLQRPIVRIVLLIPIYTINSFISLAFTKHQKYVLAIDTLRDCYEAYVIFMFFNLLEAFLEGEDQLYRYLADKPPMKHPIPFCYFSFVPGGLFLHRCKQMILQYVIISPTLAVLAIILNIEAIDGLHEGSFNPRYGYLYIVIIKNVSITLAMYWLVLFYMATHEPLAKFRPVPKFLCIKAVVFFSFWQGVAVAIMVSLGWIKEWEEGDIGRAVQNWLICIEMFFYSLFFGYAFGLKTYRDSDAGVTKQVMHQIRSLVAPSKFKSDMKDVKKILHNFTDIVSQKDVVDETLQAFVKKGRRYLLKELGSFLNAPRDEQKKRVLKSGFLEKRAKSLFTWKKRYFLVLSEPGGIVYFDGDPFESTEKQPLLSPRQDEEAGFHSLAFEPLEFIGFNTISEVDALSDPTEIKMVTPERKWVVRAESEQARNEWLELLKRYLVVKETKEEPSEEPTEAKEANQV